MIFSSPRGLAWIFLCLAWSPLLGADPAPALPQVLDKIPVDHVWAGHPVGFSLLTHPPHQFVAYYDAHRRMTVAARKFPDRDWIRQKLDARLGWDSHNYIMLALDEDGHLHVSGNMHVDPLVYFRSDKPHDVTTLKPVHRMTGHQENRVTYPQFFKTPDNRLIFMYRDGSSGQGRRFLNVYDTGTRTWRRWIDEPLLDGSGHDMNAYPAGIKRGPDGWFHMVWMWRDTPDCRSNHDISHARSRNLKEWQSMGGQPVSLPITPEHRMLVVDPVPANQGLINMGFGLGFDAAERPIVHYHRYDAKGHSQIFAARWEDSAWKTRAVSDWNYRWEFGGGGSVPCRVAGGEIHLLPDGRLVQTWRHPKHGSGAWVLDAEHLKPKAAITLPSRYPASLKRPARAFPGLQVHWREDSGTSRKPGVHYLLRWETLSRNRDRPRSGALPGPSQLVLYKLRRP